MTENAVGPLIYSIEVRRLVLKLRSRFATSEWDRTTFLSDPGGYLDYVGEFNNSPLPQQAIDRIAADAITLLFTEMGATLP